MRTAAQRPHILVIDDAPSILDPIGMLLEDEGYRVSLALRPLEPAGLLTLAPDVIVQELLFGGRPEVGWQALAQMQLTRGLTRIPVILCTTASHLVTEPAMAANLDAVGIRVVLKPFLLEDLLAAVADALAAQTLLDQVRRGQGEGSASVSPLASGGSTASS